jgi:tetratricopeptide (TPR) repeat protein
MKLGQVYFQREDYLNAQEQFETLAAAAPEGAYAETALFLAGQCGTKLFAAEAHKHALELFGKVAERKGALEPHARMQQAILKSQLGAADDAVKIYEIVLAGTAPAEVRYAALIGKGDNLTALAKTDLTQASAAIATYETLLAIPEAGPMWRNQAAYKKARVLQQIGRKDDALLVFNEILDMNAGPRERETFWLSRAGFEAAALLESQEQWKSAIGIYRKMTKIPGPHVDQAKQRVKALQQQHFIWD